MGTERAGRAEVRPMHWAQQLGVERHTRDECAAQKAKSEEEDATRANTVSLERWGAIVVCMRHLAGEFNAGAKRAVLSVVEEPAQRTVTIAAEGEGAPHLTAMLEDGTLICSDARDSSGVMLITEVRLRPDRDDASTAAYVLQNWMQRL